MREDLVVEEHHVVVVGAGMSGMGTVIRLRRDLGIDDVVILEKGPDVGGTWLYNTYPGCACDVPSSLYSYEFAPNPDWHRIFAEQPEILAYYRRVAHEHGIPQRTRFGVEVLEARWDEDTARWELETTAGALRCRILVFAPGGLHEPIVPDVPGVEDFTGTHFHTAAWDHDTSLAGKRVAVIGTGASAVQLVPHVIDEADHTIVVQRTPTWIWPKPDWKTTRLERRLYRRFPRTLGAQRRLVFALSDKLLEIYADERRARRLNAIGRAHLRAVVRDPVLRRQLTPDWTLGCKRITFSNRYYQSLQRPDATLVPHALRAVGERSITTADGTEHDVDAIVWATGFHVSDPPFADRLRGRDGRTLAEHWAGNPRAYLGAAIAGFPNAFMLFGPGSGTACCTIQLEAQLDFVLQAIGALQRHDLAALDIRPEVVDGFKALMRERLEASTWQRGGCMNFYMDGTGDNYLIYGGTMTQMLEHGREFDLGWFTATPAPAPADAPVTA